MKRIVIGTAAAALVLAICPPDAFAQYPDVTLHVNPKWKSCAIQLDPSLTQQAWRRFAQEVGLVSYFRPLTDARPLGVGNFEISLLQWQTSVDETASAWNDTFVHPDSMHWLTDGAPLPIPGLMFRGGITNRLDVGAYVTKNLQSNYGLWGGQVQYSAIHDQRRQFAASARLSMVSLYGPQDVSLKVYGMDLLASKTYALRNRISLSPYAGVSTVLSRAHETSAAVSLLDENTFGVRGTVGAAAQASAARLAVEYSVAKVSSLSFKVGVGF